MGKIKVCTVLLVFLLRWNSVIGQPILESYPVLPATTELREKLIEVAESQVGVKEATGKNDGKEIRKYLRLVGLQEGNPYCAAGMSWCHEQLSIPNPLSAWSPAWFQSNLVYVSRQPRIIPFESRQGQVFGIYYDHLQRIGHVGMITGETLLHYHTIEFNTSGAGSREGDGVYRKIRKKETIAKISDYVGYKEILFELKNQKHGK